MKNLINFLIVCGLCLFVSSCLENDDDFALAPDLNDHLVAHFPLSGDLRDMVSGSSGLLHNAEWTDGPDDNLALYLSGETYAELPHHEAYNFGTNQDFTIALKLRSAGQPTQENSTHSFLSKWCKDEGCGTQSAPFFLRVHGGYSDTPGEVLLGRRDAGSGSAGCAGDYWSSTSGVNVADGEWHAIIMVKRSSELLLYVDDILVHRGFDTTLAQCGTKNEAPVFLGCKAPHIPLHWFRGSLSDLRFYNVALDRETLRELSGE